MAQSSQPETPRDLDRPHYQTFVHQLSEGFWCVLVADDQFLQSAGSSPLTNLQGAVARLSRSLLWANAKMQTDAAPQAAMAMQPGWGNANAELLLRIAASWQMTAGQVPAVAQEQDFQQGGHWKGHQRYSQKGYHQQQNQRQLPHRHQQRVVHQQPTEPQQRSKKGKEKPNGSRSPLGEPLSEDAVQLLTSHLMAQVLSQRVPLEEGRSVQLSLPDWLDEVPQSSGVTISAERRTGVNRALRHLSNKLPGCCWTVGQTREEIHVFLADAARFSKWFEGGT